MARHQFINSVALGFRNRPENNVILRKHNEPKLIEAMEYWWACIEKSAGRDQISLPYVREKFQLNEKIYNFNARVVNPYFRIYPHRKNKIHLDLGTVLYAKSLTNQFYKPISKIYSLLLRIVLKISKIIVRKK